MKKFLPHWFWPVMDRLFWPALAIVLAFGFYIAVAALTGMG